MTNWYGWITRILWPYYTSSHGAIIHPQAQLYQNIFFTSHSTGHLIAVCSLQDVDKKWSSCHIFNPPWIYRQKASSIVKALSTISCFVRFVGDHLHLDGFVQEEKSKNGTRHICKIWSKPSILASMKKWTWLPVTTMYISTWRLGEAFGSSSGSSRLCLLHGQLVPKPLLLTWDGGQWPNAEPAIWWAIQTSEASMSDQIVPSPNGPHLPHLKKPHDRIVDHLLDISLWPLCQDALQQGKGSVSCDHVPQKTTAMSSGPGSTHSSQVYPFAARSTLQASCWASIAPHCPPPSQWNEAALHCWRFGL